VTRERHVCFTWEESVPHEQKSKIFRPILPLTCSIRVAYSPRKGFRRSVNFRNWIIFLVLGIRALSLNLTEEAAHA
jgi:hypothetical protein